MSSTLINNKLSARENFLRMMKGDSPERIPLDMPMTPPVLQKISKDTGMTDVNDFLGNDFRGIFPNFADNSEAWRKAYSSIGVEIKDSYDIDAFGVCNKKPEGDSLGECTHMSQLVHVLEEVEDVEDLEKLPFPDMNDPALYADFSERVESIHAQGYVAVGAMTCSVFEHSWYLRGMDSLFMDWMEESEVGEWLMDWYMERTCAAVREYCKAGVDVVFLGDDIGSQGSTLMSPAMWRQHLKPRMQKIINTVREYQKDKVWITYHTDGAVEPLIPELFEIGIDILNPVQPECMNVNEVLANYSHLGAFWGMIGTQSVMPFGSSDEVRQKVREVIEHAKNGVRMVVAPTHVLEPDVPLENIYTLRDELTSFRF